MPNIVLHQLNDEKGVPQFVILEVGSIELTSTDLLDLQKMLVSYETNLPSIIESLLDALKDEIEGHAAYREYAKDLERFLSEKSFENRSEYQNVVNRGEYQNLVNFVKVLITLSNEEARHSRFIAKALNDYKSLTGAEFDIQKPVSHADSSFD